MKRYLIPLALLAGLCAPSAVQACGGMSPAQLAALMERLARMDAQRNPAPPAAAPTPTPVTEASTTDPTPPSQSAPEPVAFVPPPPPPPPMVQLSPGALNGGLTTRTQVVESQNEQVTQDLHEGLIIS